MATTNVSLTPVGWTYTNSWQPNTNYAFSNTLDMGVGWSLHGESKVILQFDIPTAMSGAKINSAIINLDIIAWWDSSQTVTSDLTIKFPLNYSSAVTTGYVFGSITHNNYGSLITQGVRNKVNVFSGEKHYYSNQIDVTGVVANNINSNILTIIIEGAIGVQTQQISANSISLAMNYEEVDPIAPLVIVPNGTYENRSNDIKFEWIYKSQTEATQASATLEYRQGTSGAYTQVNVYSSNNYYVMPAYIFSEGVVEWRIKTTDTDGKTSEYANGNFTVIDRPSVPIITDVENKCISTIKWSSADQIAFEVEVYKGDELEFSKKISSSTNNYKPNMFFSNTTYTIRLRVCNIYGLWSEWGNKIFTFTFTNPGKPKIIVSPKNSDIIIHTDTEGAILYKSSDNINFIPIYKFTDNKEYRDYNISNNKVYKYFVRKYESGYTDSDKQVTQVSINGIILQNDNFCVNAEKSSDTYMNYIDSLSVDKTINYYSGRVFGVAEYGEHQSRTITRDILIDVSQYDTLKQLYLSAIPIVYRDNKGNLFRCDLDKPTFKSAVLDTKYSISVTVNQLDYVEEINIYD